MFCVFSQSNPHHLALPSFPTRRSSDLNVGYSNFSQPQSHLSFCVLLQYLVERRRVVTQLEAERKKRDEIEDRKSGSAGMPRPISYAVFCLKKKTRLSRLHAIADAPTNR